MEGAIHNSKKINRVIIAGGGTGGHIFPAVSIANALKKMDGSIQLLFVGAKGKMEMEKIPQAGYEIRGLDIAGFNRSSLLKNISLPFKLIKSFIQVKDIFSEFRPDAVVGVGGYSSFPVLKYAQAKGIRTFIHESNAFAGKSNIMLGKNATKVFVAADGMQKFFPADRLLFTGNPVRSEIIGTGSVDRSEARAHFKLSADKTTVLVVGGSLGARSINEAILQDLHDIVANDIQLIWQTGKTNAEKWQDAAKDQRGIYVSEFISRMDMAYAAADIVVSRAGAMAVAELCLVKKPVIFVPYPHAAEDHQTMNAKNLVDKHAALMVKDSEAKEVLVPEIMRLVNNVSLQQELKENIGEHAVTNAAESIAEKILNS